MLNMRSSWRNLHVCRTIPNIFANTLPFDIPNAKVAASHPKTIL
jgi:hypothetical protein